MLTFPKDEAIRNQWLMNINRVETTNRTIKIKDIHSGNLLHKKQQKGDRWEANVNAKICSIHFIDGKPTSTNPYPTENMGHTSNCLKIKKRKEPLQRSPYVTNSSKKRKIAKLDNNITSDIKGHSDAFLETKKEEQNYCFKCNCQNDCLCKGCYEKQLLIMSMQARILELEEELTETKKNEKKKDASNKNVKALNMLKICLSSDKQTKFYTGLPSTKIFEALFEFLFEKVRKMSYWIGSKKTVVNKVRRFVVSPKKFGKSRNLPIKAELLLTLIKLRLGLLNHDIADRFGVSDSVISSVLNTWIKVLGNSLRFLIHYPDKESVRENLPRSFQRLYPRIRCIIDCTEVFIDRPRDLFVQAVTWSDYKKHNTAKVLIGITPRGCISFVSDVWGGRASDRHITLNSSFLDNIEPYDQIMADKGFLLGNEILLRRGELVLPPGARGHDQMSGESVRKTKQIANLRIHVERAIQRLKNFRILKNQLPITLLPMIDNIVVTCASLCNLDKALVQ